ncbi:MAG: hypothetical protein VX245_10890 [Pseudomonadota bacterium]|nr:hypothetical protein [Pseudomonadota bacterium]
MLFDCRFLILPIVSFLYFTSLGEVREILNKYYLFSIKYLLKGISEVNYKTLFLNVTLLSLLLAGCGGGSGGSSTDSSEEGLTDLTDSPVLDDSQSNDDEEDTRQDGDNTLTRDLIISDPDYSVGSTILRGLSWPHGDVQVGAPVYAAFNNSSSHSIEKGVAATDTVDASDFTPVVTTDPSNGEPFLRDIESVRYTEADGSVNRWLMSCDNTGSNGRAMVKVYSENNPSPYLAAVPLFSQEIVQGVLQTWTIDNCKQISIASVATASSGFDLVLWVIGQGTLSNDGSNAYEFLVRIDMDYNKNGAPGTRVGGIPTLVSYVNTAQGEYLSVAGFSSDKAIVASYTQMSQSNEIRIIGDSYNQPLMITQQNKFTGTNGFMDVADIHLWKKNTNDYRIYTVSGTTGVYAIQWDAGQDQKTGEQTYSSGDIQHCTGSITGFRDPTATGRLWCHDNTNAGNLLEFEAPAIATTVL